MKLFINILIVLMVVAVGGYALYHFNNRIDNIEQKQSQLDTKIDTDRERINEIIAKISINNPAGAYIEEPTKQTDFSKEIDE